MIKKNSGHRVDEQHLREHVPDKKCLCEHMRENDSKYIGKRPLFSLVMPVYNLPEPFFGFAVRSILDQHFTDWELCIVDDASTDASV